MSDSLRINLDLGASGIKAAVVDGAYSVLAEAAASYETQSPEPGWAEQRPDGWWRACSEAIAAAGRKVSLAAIDRVTLSGDLRGAVFLDGEMEVIRPAILGADVRAAGGFGLVVQWLRGNQTIAFKRLQHLLTPQSYVRFLLTGELAIESDDAATTGLFDSRVGEWSVALCDDAEINLDLLPKVNEGRELRVLDNIADEFGLCTGTLVVAGRSS